MKLLEKLRVEHLILVGSVTTIFAATLVLAPRPRSLGYDPKNEKQGSSHYSSPLGAKAYFTLLEALGTRTFRHERALELLPQETREVFLLGSGRTFSAVEIEWIQGWVSRGGTLVWSPRRGAPLETDDPVLAAFGLELRDAGKDRDVELEASLLPLDRRETRAYKLSVGIGLRLDRRGGERGPEPLAKDDTGWVAAIAPRGEGRLVAFADPELFGNGSISRADHAEFLVRLAQLGSGGAPVAFEEFHHGFTEGQSAFAILWASPLRAVMILSVVAAFCGVFASGRRLGPPVDLHEERRRRPAEFIEAFAGLCRKMKADPQALSMVLSEFKLHLQQAHGASTPEAVARLALRSGLDPAAVAARIDRAERLSKGRMNDGADLVSCCRDLEQLRRSFRNPQITRKAT